MSKQIINSFIQLFFLIIIPVISAFCQSETDEAFIHKIVQDEVTAWNRGDAVAYGEHFANDGTFTNILGAFYKGHDIFVKEHAQIFKTIFLGTRLQQDIVSLQFVDPNVVVVEVLTAVSGMKKIPGRIDNYDAKGRLRTRLLQVVARREGKWEIVAYHNVEVKDALHAPEPE